MRFLYSILFYLNVCFISAQILIPNPVYANSNLPSDVKIPPAFELSNNLWLPSVNQFVIVPLTGKVVVYYIGIFNNSNNLTEENKNFVLPFPKGANTPPVISVSLEPGVQQIQKSFTLNAPLGSFEWRPEQFNFLPGVTVILLKDPSAKITMKSADFIHDTSDINADGSQYVRVSWNQDTAYPRFVLSNMVPSRVWSYSIIIIFALILFSVLWISVKIRRTRMSN